MVGRVLVRKWVVTADVAAGEYGAEPGYFRRMCAEESVDCLQVDATRCGGLIGFLRAAAVTEFFGLEVSAHTAPQLHAAVAASVPNIRHLEMVRRRRSLRRTGGTSRSHAPAGRWPAK